MNKIKQIGFLLLLFFFSCSNENKKPTLELINEEVFFTDIEDTIDNLNYLNSEQKAKSTNLITFKLSNPTNKKFLFCFNKDEFNFLFYKQLELSPKPDMYFLINDSISTLKAYMPFITFDSISFEMLRNSEEFLFETSRYNDSIKRVKYSLLGVDVENMDIPDKYIESYIRIEVIDNYIKNSIILNPKETKTFNILLNLPIIKELNLKTGERPVYIKEIDINNKFQLLYNSNARYLISVLPEYLLKELEENNIEIFDGTLYSNEISLIKRQITNP